MIRLFLLILLSMPVANVWAQNSQLPAPEGQAKEIPAAVTSEMVSMEANVVEIVLNDEHHQGVDWAAIVSDFHTVPLKNTDDAASDDKRTLSVGTVSDEDYGVLLDALDTVGHVRQLHFPAFTFSASKDASEALNDEIKLGAGFTHSKAGNLILNIAPQINVTIGGGRSRPSVTQLLQAKSDVAFKENTTIVIGGIFKEEEITKTHRFPLLGSLPLVGLVFRSQGRLVQKTETVIFLSPSLRSGVSPVDQLDEVHASH